MQKIAGLAQEMMRDFEAAVAVTRGWEGEGDSFARENKPRVAAENKAASETVRAVAEAISSAADATAGNVKSIQSHQGGVVDAVREEARKSEGLGRR
ncbi:hypothetical protein ACFQ60_47515 [Streptomyces zhihengii]|uniref:Uncharacterized protein n=1 Tax=Streptomyces zhihengii TaxID=1818004 RepID=A0ABS2V3T5_9ACTN|nr:hypothetical protein [Streptomyces zhihengii]MBM9624500.1 hypothetical protein [Streptomyces zhihengii]MBM9624506.1 hypothetical protein [Streptomyces zhihengii]